MTINESFILNVFKAMTVYRPKLGYLLPDDDSEDLDIRKLAAEIISGYPWPIGVELRRLLSASMDRPERGRLDQIFRTLERSMQFLSFVLLIQLFEEHRKKPLSLPANFTNEFSRRFSTLTMGTFAWLIRILGDIFTANAIPTFAVGMEKILTNAFYKKLDFWTPERNEIGHYQITLTEEEVEVRCNEYLGRLESIIADIAFLIACPLLTITEISVMKPKNQLPRFHHRMLVLNSASSDFSGKDKDYDKFTDSHAVMLVNSLNNAPERYLNLSPLIIDTHFETMGTREKLRKVRKDVYLYTKYSQKDQRLFYIGTEAEEKADITAVSFYNQLTAEFGELMEAFAPPAPQEGGG